MRVIMLSILVVGPAETPIASANAQVEILRAHSIDEAVEKLARNRRIDAILILSAPLACDVVGKRPRRRRRSSSAAEPTRPPRALDGSPKILQKRSSRS
jgi:hypothetical protein